MSFEEEFDRIIRQKMEANKVPFNEGDWQKANNLIEKNRLSTSAVSSTKRFYKIGALSFVVAALTTISFLVVKDPSGKTDIAVKEVQNTRVQENSARPAEPPTSQKKATASLEEFDTKRIAGFNKETPPVDGESASVQSGQNKIENGNGLTTEQEKSLASKVNETSSDEKEPLVAAVMLPPVNEAKEQEAVPSATNDEPVLSGNMAEDTKIEQLHQQIFGLEYRFQEPELLAQSIGQTRLIDQDYYKKGAGSIMHFLLLEGGVNYHLGWMDVNGVDGKGLNWYAGITYGYNFNKHLGISAGVQSYAIGHIQTPFYNSSQKVYSFGSAQSQTVLTCNSLLYAAVPIKIHYTTNNKWRFAAGVNAGIVAEAKNTVQTTQLSDGVVVASETHSENGLYSGVNAYSFLLSASLSKQIANRLEFQAEFNYGLSDLFENTASNTNKQLGNSIRIGLNYRLFTR